MFFYSTSMQKLLKNSSLLNNFYETKKDFTLICEVFFCADFYFVAARMIASATSLMDLRFAMLYF